METPEEKKMELQIVRLEEEQIRQLYHCRMAEDFPPDELRPYPLIRSLMNEGIYEAYAAFSEGKPAAYACFAVLSEENCRTALLDYYAVVPEMRGKGIGTVFLKKLITGHVRTDCLLIENESPEAIPDPSEINMRRRRIAFYERCGAIRTGVRSHLYHVDYDILVVLSSGNKAGKRIPDDREVFRLTDHVYHRILPKDWFPSLVSLSIHS